MRTSDTLLWQEAQKNWSNQKVIMNVNMDDILYKKNQINNCSRK